MEYDILTGRLPVPGLCNARDLGVLHTQDGKALASHRLVRSDSLDRLSAQDVELLASYPIEVVIDLRTSSEASHEPDVIRDDPRFSYYNISLLQEAKGELLSNPVIVDTRSSSLGHLYVWMAEYSKKNFAEVYRVILHEAPRAVLFHCAHGKDRTGLIAALLYLLCGVSREDIIRNYAISYDYVRDLVAPLIANTPVEEQHIYRSDASNMVMFLNHLEKNYHGDAREYLRSTGLTDEEIHSLRNLLLPENESFSSSSKA